MRKVGVAAEADLDPLRAARVGQGQAVVVEEEVAEEEEEGEEVGHNSPCPVR